MPPTVQSRVAVFDTKPYDREFLEPAFRAAGIGAQFLRPRLGADTVRLAEGARAVCAFVNDDLSTAVVDQLASMGVGLIALRCAGFNNVDFKAAYGRIHVARVPAYSPYAVAEHAVALVLALNRKTHKAWFRTRDSNFSIQGLLGFDMHGKTAGIVGAGRIGRVLAGILRGFGMRVLAHDAVPDPAWAAASGVEFTDLDTLYREADVISLHCPLTPETRSMINAASIAKMKRGVMLINTGRGKLIDSKALLAGLKSGRVGAAGLDVYEEEERYFFEDFSASGVDDDVLARLMTFPNVLITSHQAFFTREALAHIAETTACNIRQFLDGAQLGNEICYQCCEGSCRRKTEGRCF